MRIVIPPYEEKKELGSPKKKSSPTKKIANLLSPKSRKILTRSDSQSLSNSKILDLSSIKTRAHSPVNGMEFYCDGLEEGCGDNYIEYIGRFSFSYIDECSLIDSLHRLLKKTHLDFFQLSTLELRQCKLRESEIFSAEYDILRRLWNPMVKKHLIKLLLNPMFPSMIESYTRDISDKYFAINSLPISQVQKNDSLEEIKEIKSEMITPKSAIEAQLRFFEERIGNAQIKEKQEKIPDDFFEAVSKAEIEVLLQEIAESELSSCEKEYLFLLGNNILTIIFEQHNEKKVFFKFLYNSLIDGLSLTISQKKKCENLVLNSLLLYVIQPIILNIRIERTYFSETQLQGFEQEFCQERIANGQRSCSRESLIEGVVGLMKESAHDSVLRQNYFEAKLARVLMSSFQVTEIEDEQSLFMNLITKIKTLMIRGLLSASNRV
ncbi:MAG: hypothetical protein KC505_07625 [Myxococcales bacterium]|nr:hypothetical protein [Myxococcales bacterium]USN51562.1 MAG: hypothetical protein H6731_03905 [Myxococcales bacterium]